MDTSGLLVVTLAIIAALWDGYVMITYGIKYTESYWLAQVAHNCPTFTLAIGILIGHFFARMTNQGPIQ